MPRPKKGIVEVFRQHLNNARAVIQNLEGAEPKYAATLLRRLDNLEIDFRRYIYGTGETAHYIIVNPSDGTSFELSRSKAELLKWRENDPAGYEVYVQRMQDLLKNFRDDSLIVKLLGRNGEYVLPPTIATNAKETDYEDTYSNN